MVLRVQLANWGLLVHRGYLEKVFKDKRGSLDFRVSLAPEVLLDRVCRGIREIEGSEVRKAKRETEVNLERQEPSDLWVELDKRESLDLQGKKSSK